MKRDEGGGGEMGRGRGGGRRRGEGGGERERGRRKGEGEEKGGKGGGTVREWGGEGDGIHSHCTCHKGKDYAGQCNEVGIHTPALEFPISSRTRNQGVEGVLS